MIKNLGILISKSFFLGLASLEQARQSTSRSICLSLMIIDLEVISRELLGPTDLTRAQAFCIHESTEVIMVNKDEDLIFTLFQIVALSFKGLNNG